MAVLKIVTASNWPQVSGREFIEAVIGRYRFRGHSSNLTVEVKDTDEGQDLAINGRTGFAAFPEENVDSKDDLSDPEKVLY
ncbi:hypothetical protein [Halorussus sp. AFM4]|uniref:hypothetical protein n=1 Tax=Halorussus sp. AFM4 TaxID=3421651 RepID=UPI003EBC3B4E